MQFKCNRGPRLAELKYLNVNINISINANIDTKMILSHKKANLLDYSKHLMRVVLGSSHQAYRCICEI